MPIRRVIMLVVFLTLATVVVTIAMVQEGAAQNINLPGNVGSADPYVVRPDTMPDIGARIVRLGLPKPPATIDKKQKPCRFALLCPRERKRSEPSEG